MAVVRCAGLLTAARAIEPRKGRAFAEVKVKHLRVFPLPDPADKGEAYREYQRRTSAFLPLPRRG